jgi:hypothetical protein
MQNEVVIYCSGYDVVTPGLQTTIRSACNIDASVIVILDDFKKTDIEWYRKTPHIRNVVLLSELKSRFNIDTNLSPYTLKTICFYLYSKHISEADAMYLCDSTDIFIQRNVFDLVADTSKTYVSSENALIRTCATNTQWINICYNTDIYNLLSRYEILNGGSILGTRSQCVYLLDEMCKDMALILSRVGGYPNIDQASLNKCVYFDCDNYKILNSYEIANMAHLQPTRQAIVDNLVTLTINGADVQPYVIHQYDGHSELEYLVSTCLNKPTGYEL